MSRLSRLIRNWRSRRGRGLQAQEPEAPGLPPRRDFQIRLGDWPAIRNEPAADYAELGQHAQLNRPQPIFITARFRSGSTMLWNMLRQVPGMTAYYEPLHPTLQQPSGDRLKAEDPTHVGVHEYWSEYEQIADFPQVEHCRPWHNTDLYLDETAWKPRLAEYLDLLISSTSMRAALQFNRVDFRLAWLRRIFPTAQIVHLYRHPRDQWLSVLRDPSKCGPDATLEDFVERDYFFLAEWVHDLSAHFPMLDWDLVDHPYQMHFLIWKLSYLWGRNYSDISIGYEQLLANPFPTLRNLFSILDLDPQSIPRLTQFIRPNPVGKWCSYADNDWFERHEQRAEQLLSSFLGPQSMQQPSRVIRRAA